MTTWTFPPSSGGSVKPARVREKPFFGSSSPLGGSKRKLLPSGVFRESASGLNLRSPEKARATVSSGEARNDRVSGFSSLRPRKLRLYDETMVLTSPFLMSSRFH